MTKLIQSIATIRTVVDNKFLTEKESNSHIANINLFLEKIKQENGFLDLGISEDTRKTLLEHFNIFENLELSIDNLPKNIIINPLITLEIQYCLEKNHKLNHMYSDQHFQPVAKLYSTTSSAIWLITEIDEDGILYGFFDNGFKEPDFDYIELEELEQRLKESGYPDIKRDTEWTPTATIDEYADRAMKLKSLSLAIIEIDKENASKA